MILCAYWPYRLTVRTKPSQGLNRGSIPRKVTGFGVAKSCDLTVKPCYGFTWGIEKRSGVPVEYDGSRAADTRKVCDGKLLLAEDSRWGAQILVQQKN